MVLERDLGRILDLFGRSAHHGRQTRGCHRRRRADFALASDLRARDRGVHLDDAANGCRGEQEVADAAPVCIDVEALPVFQTAGMTPAAPLVGAVTMRPPAAFSSLTAIA